MEHTICGSQVRHHNHYATEPHKYTGCYNHALKGNKRYGGSFGFTLLFEVVESDCVFGNRDIRSALFRFRGVRGQPRQPRCTAVQKLDKAGVDDNAELQRRRRRAEITRRRNKTRGDDDDDEERRAASYRNDSASRSAFRPVPRDDR